MTVKEFRLEVLRLVSELEKDNGPVQTVEISRKKLYTKDLIEYGSILRTIDIKF